MSDTDNDQSRSEILDRLFQNVQTDHLEHFVLALNIAFEQAKYAFLPREKLVEMALQRDELKEATDNVFAAMYEAWGDDENAWPLTDEVRHRLGHLFVHMLEIDEQEGLLDQEPEPVAPTGATTVRRNGAAKRRRRGPNG